MWIGVRENTRLGLVVLVFLMAPWRVGGAETAAKGKEGAGASFTLSSPAFEHEAPIPPRYTADGMNVSPALKWSGLPAGTKSLVLTCDDPDAPGGAWVHWVMYDIEVALTELRDTMSRSKVVMGVGKQGVNSFKGYGYAGPAPPRGKLHHYVFRLYALDKTTDVPGGASKEQVLKATEGHVLGKAELVGTYKRQ
jgi:Raf kinase inhibitor-like YbhB/YbcL family protein